MVDSGTRVRRFLAFRLKAGVVPCTMVTSSNVWHDDYLRFSGLYNSPFIVRRRMFHVFCPTTSQACVFWVALVRHVCVEAAHWCYL